MAQHDGAGEPATPPGAQGLSRRAWLGGLLGTVSAGAALVHAPATRAEGGAEPAGASVPATQRLRPPRLLLARTAAPDIDPAPFLVSEKLDGVRALWDGEALRLRSGARLAPPAAWRPLLPAEPLDGELWAGRGGFERASAAVRRALDGAAAADFEALRYRLFERPLAGGDFEARAAWLRQHFPPDEHAPVAAVPQQRVADNAALRRWLAERVEAGGEGLMLHRADAPYRTGRSGDLWRLKPVDEAEAVVIGHLPGRGRLAGRLGALRVRDEQGRVFALGSGLSDALREAPPPPGSLVIYRHRGLTARGLPRFATLWRVLDGPAAGVASIARP